MINKRQTLMVILVLVMTTSFMTSPMQTHASAGDYPEGRLYYENSQLRSRISTTVLESITNGIPAMQGDLFFSAHQSASVGADDESGRLSSSNLFFDMSFITSHSIEDDDYDNNGINDCLEGVEFCGTSTFFETDKTEYYFQVLSPSGYFNHSQLIGGLRGEGRVDFRIGDLRIGQDASIASELELTVSLAANILSALAPGYALAIGLTGEVVKYAIGESDPSFGENEPGLTIEEGTKDGQPALKFTIQSKNQFDLVSGSSLKVLFDFIGVDIGLYRIITSYSTYLNIYPTIDHYPEPTISVIISAPLKEFDFIRHDTDTNNHNNRYARIIKVVASDGHALPTLKADSTGTNLQQTVNGENWFIAWGPADNAIGSTFYGSAATAKTNYEFSSWMLDQSTFLSYSATTYLTVYEHYSELQVNYIYTPPPPADDPPPPIGGGCGPSNYCLTP